MIIENVFSRMRDDVITLKKVLNKTVPFVLYREGKLSLRISRFPLKSEDGNLDRKGDRLVIKDGERFPVTIRVQKRKNEVAKEMRCLFEVHSSSGHLLAANVLPFCENDVRTIVQHKDKSVTAFEEVSNFLSWFLANDRNISMSKRTLSLKRLETALPKNHVLVDRYLHYKKQVEKGEEIIKKVSGTKKEKLSQEILNDNLDRLATVKKLLST